MNKEIIPKEKEVYKDYIIRIKNARENKKDRNRYMEKHHILPKSQGGNNEDYNLIYLYPIEHYHAHRLLSLENPNNLALARAWWLMSHMRNERNDWDGCTAEQYGEAKEKFYKMLSEHQKGKPMPRECIEKNNLWKQEQMIPVLCIETNTEYNSFTQASNLTGIPEGNIRHAAIGERQTAGGYHWKIVNPTNKQIDEFNKNRQRLDKTKQYKPILCYETGIVYESCNRACEELNIDIRNLSAVLNGKRNTVKGYHFEFLFPTKEQQEKIIENKEKLNNYKNNKPHMFNGEIKCVETQEIFKNQSQAAKAKNIHSQNISAVLVGKQKTAGGFHWVVI